MDNLSNVVSQLTFILKMPGGAITILKLVEMPMLTSKRMQPMRPKPGKRIAGIINQGENLLANILTAAMLFVVAIVLPAALLPA
ncbi:LOW QUALITY PROTEIN: hypothetical protein MAR_005201 [Mya arenaria]|uniref:Uncharacterized protein n=1 Tax=Mya arenaria TaxID=6604 RepID=A0ABY7F2Q0_MYAAR|nr:LOW QUALITY PROTEIN: hypothetical protein MAR_005201 [Mya arenaria]